MSQTIFLKLKPETYQKFIEIHGRLNAGDRQDLAKSLGANLADISCDVIDQVFGQMIRTSESGDRESEKTIQTVLETMRKYMPWSVSFFGNDRLVPMVNYLEQLMVKKGDHTCLTYQVPDALVNELLGYAERMKQGENQYVKPGLKAFTDIVDQGVTSLIREPKKMLKFNVVVDKTLNGVINVTTQLGYKRFDKLSTQYDGQTISKYFDHFLVFLGNDDKNTA